MLSTEELLNKAKAKIEKGILNKSQQKEILDTINNAFYSAHEELSKEILKERNTFAEGSEEYNNLEQLYYKVPYEAYRWNEKAAEIFSEYESSKKLAEIAKFWREIKSIGIIKVVKSAEQQKEEKISKDIENTSSITDKKKYSLMVNKMIDALDAHISSYYNKIAAYRIKLSKLSKEELLEDMKSDSFKTMYNTFILGKTSEQILEQINREKSIFLLDTKVKIIKKINFDIDSYKYLDGLRWEINGSKIFEIETIIAGGYNIQRLHHRVIIKLRKK